MVSESEMFEKSFDHFWFFIFLVTLATVPVSFSIYYHFLCKMFTNFSPIRHVNDVKGTYFVKKINIYLIKNSFVFTSRGPRIFGFISWAAHFRGASWRFLALKKATLEVATFNLQKLQGFAQSWGPCLLFWHPLNCELYLNKMFTGA